MRKMMKKISTAMLAAVVVLVAAGCGSAGGEADSSFADDAGNGEQRSP